MIDYTILKDVSAFLESHAENYAKLVECIRDAAEEVAEKLGREVVYDVYSRSKKPGGKETKDPIKIAIKVGRKRANNPLFRIEEVNDVVGLTIAVTYNEHVTQVISVLKKALARRDIRIGKPSIKNTNGYYATHIDCTAKNGAYHGLMCEVQVKTMLHSAWGVKTHDLTYKPQGYHDHGLDEVTRSIGDMIEMIERQSGELYRLIQRQSEVERKARNEALRLFFRSMRNHYQPSDTHRPRFAEIDRRLRDESARIAKLPEGASELRSLQTDIGELAQVEPQSWQLAVSLAHIREGGDQLGFAIRLIEAFREESKRRLQTARDAGARRDAEARLFVAVCAFYLLGVYDKTLIAGYETLELNLSELCRSNIAFNLATYLIERECHLPSKKEDVQRSLDEIRRLLAMVEITFEDEIRATTDALFEIAFSNDVEKIQDAISICGAKKTDAPKGEEDVAEAYSKYYVALGWRRLFRVR